MKKNLFGFLLIFLVQTSFAQTTVPASEQPASDTQPAVDSPQKAVVAPVDNVFEPQNSRKGFVAGVGLGVGGIHIGGGANFDKPGFFDDLRVGGGLTDRVILLGESFSAMTKNSGVTTTVTTINFSTQLFFCRNFYVRPGVGLAMTSASTKTGNVTTIVESDTGFSALAASGYEFRIGKIFALSPEVIGNYDRINGNNVINYGGIVTGVFYF